MDFLTTAKIDQELQDCKNTIPLDWWTTSPSIDMSLEKLHDMFRAKFCYHHVRRFLHLPFMLKVSSDIRYEYSRVVTLESSREMIKVYQILRNPQRPAITICDVVDYQAFTTSMSLIINLLTYSQSYVPRDLQQDELDWDIIYNLKQYLRQFSEERPCSVATQAVRLLDDFCRARYGLPNPGDHICQVAIPYFRVVRVSSVQGTSSNNDSSTALQN
ncbi:MAG: hypothetical protein M1834_009179 [Cirrosporium novae-zelandiae]|nr:MAG: hypothetical protein M1834_009179 [Cirrosporium novae-zelandiae]